MTAAARPGNFPPARFFCPSARRPAMALLAIGLLSAVGGCKTLSERYIALEVWKYERCFGHPPPGFVGGPAAAAGATGMRPCGSPAAAPCAPAQAPMAGNCDACGGAAGMAGGPVMGGVPVVSEPGIGIPTPAPSPVSAGRPVIISDEIVSP